MKSRPEMNALTDGYPLLVALYLLLRAWFGASLWWLALLHTFALYLFLPLILVLLLALALRRPRSALVSLVLLILGGWLYLPRPNRKRNTDHAHLRVIQFNARPENPQLAEDAQWLLQQNPDVIILEEIVSENHEPALDVLYAAFPHNVYIQSSIRLFSRHPILEQEQIWLEEPGEFHGRLAIRAVIDMEGQPITVYGVHLTLPWQDEPHIPIYTHRFLVNVVLRYDETRRNQQIRDLLARVQREENPVIIAGDFNTSHTSPTYKEIAASGLLDAYAEVGQGWGMTWPAHGGLLPPLLRIDYVWHTADLVTLRARLGAHRGS
ncbi:MAG: endonuclease/exonuclease/phosphatase family protein, partial [Anaerolineae bacterium]|nr:endonuclease/exonuclease/phosphatase family protein [Anaerolineae bacterium]